MDVAMKMAVRTYAINQNRAMHILAMEKFDVGNGPSGDRDLPGNMLDGIKLEQTYRQGSEKEPIWEWKVIGTGKYVPNGKGF